MLLSAANSPRISEARTFNGTSDFAQAAVDLSAYNKITLSFWLYWDVFATDDRIAIEFSSNINTHNNVFFVLPNSSSFAGNFPISIHDASGYSGVNFTPPSAAAWHHYTVPMDRSVATSQVVAVYIDGVSQSLTRHIDTATTGNFANETLNFMSRGGSSLFGAGKLHSVAIHPGVLLTTAQAKLLAKGADPRSIDAVAPIYYENTYFNPKFLNPTVFLDFLVPHNLKTVTNTTAGVGDAVNTWFGTGRNALSLLTNANTRPNKTVNGVYFTGVVEDHLTFSSVVVLPADLSVYVVGGGPNSLVRIGSSFDNSSVTVESGNAVYLQSASGNAGPLFISPIAGDFAMRWTRNSSDAVRWAVNGQADAAVGTIGGTVTLETIAQRTGFADGEAAYKMIFISSRKLTATEDALMCAYILSKYGLVLPAMS